jgi:hypothetical protein
VKGAAPPLRDQVVTRLPLQLVDDVRPARGQRAGAARAQRNAWLDERLRALSAEDRAVIARATALLSDIADS